MKNQMTGSEFLAQYGELDDMKKMSVLRETNITDLADFSEEISRSFVTRQGKQTFYNYVERFM